MFSFVSQETTQAKKVWMHFSSKAIAGEVWEQFLTQNSLKNTFSANTWEIRCSAKKLFLFRVLKLTLTLRLALELQKPRYWDRNNCEINLTREWMCSFLSSFLSPELRHKWWSQNKETEIYLETAFKSPNHLTSVICSKDASSKWTLVRNGH